MKLNYLLLSAALVLTGSYAKSQTPEIVVEDEVYNLAVSNGKIYFAGEGEAKNTTALWISDGTTAGTKRLKEIQFPQNPKFTEFNGKTFFMAKDAAKQVELWATDGTTAGTYMVKDINPTGDGCSSILGSYNGLLYFEGNDGVYGKELWMSDGTENGTKMLKDINPGNASGLSYSAVFNFEDKMYFDANDGTHSAELWVSDGTEEGTTMLKDINPTGSSYPSMFTIVGSKLYFIANTENEGGQLWVTDGTAPGTVLVKDIVPGTGSSPIMDMIEFDGKLYFTAKEVVPPYLPPYGLWVSDGTTAGTTLLEENVGDMGGVFNGSLYFGKVIGGDDNFKEYGLYKSNGKPGGASMVKAISGGHSKTDPYKFKIANGKLYFLCNYDSGAALYLSNDLWETDGTIANTKLVEMSPGNLVNVFSRTGLTVYNGSLYYTDGNTPLYRIGTVRTGIIDVSYSEPDVRLFPNPTSNSLQIQLPQSEYLEQVSVRNINGQLIESSFLTAPLNCYSIIALNYPAGIYFVHLQTQSKKLIVKKFVRE